MSERRVRRDVAAPQSAWRDESGKAAIRGLIGLLLVVGLVYSGYKFLPVRVAAYTFEDAVRDEIISAGGRRRTTDETIRKNLMQVAQSSGLPIRESDIRITRPGAKYIVVDVSYTVRIELVGGYVFDWPLTAHGEGPLLF